MKKIASLLSMCLVLLGAITLTSCHDDPELTVDDTDVPVSADGGQVSFGLYANEEAGTWTISSNKDWVRVSPKQGTCNHTINLTVEKNQDTNERPAELTIQSKAGMTIVTVLQKGAESDITVTPRELLMSASGGSASFHVSSNTKWTANSSASWCTVANTNGEKDGNVTLIADANNEKERSCTVTVSTTDGKKSTTVTVKQSGIDEVLTVTPGTISFLPTANERKNITITASGKWKIENKDNADWLSYDSEGTGNTTIEIATKSANESASPRTARLVFSLTSNSSKTQTVTITQDPLYSDVYVKPADWVAIHDEFFEACEIAWEYKAVNGKHTVNQFRYMILPESDLKNWTKKEIVAEIGKQELLKFSLEWLSTLVFDSNDNIIQTNTTYHYYSIAYDENDNPGELYEEVIKTPKYYNANDDAYVGFDNISFGNNGFSFHTTLEGRAKKYHVIYGNLDPERLYLGALFAFELNYYLKYNKKHWFAESWYLDIQADYPNPHEFWHSANIVGMSPYSLLTAWGWGVFENGTNSTCVTGFEVDWTEYATKGQKKIASKKKSGIKLQNKRYDYFAKPAPSVRKSK